MKIVKVLCTLSDTIIPSYAILMKIPAGDGYVIEVEQAKKLGSAWTVRVYRKVLFLKRQLSSDWFLNEEQAMQYAREAAEEIRNGTALLEERRPGWRLRQPAH